jgi:hypothetical protein
MRFIHYLLCWACLLSCTLVPGAGYAQERPLPNRQAFLAEARARLDRDEERQAGYSYVETRKRFTLDGTGRARSETTRVIESYPGLPGEPRWERVLEEDGRRTSDADLARADAVRRRKVERYARKITTQSDGDRRRLRENGERDRRETAARVDDVFLVYDLQMLGREAIDGHDTIVLSMNPRPDARPRTREGGWLRRFRGRVWVSETDYELVKLDVEAIRDVSIGLGLVGRIHKGTTFSFGRRKVNGDRWLPAFASYTVSGRLLLLKRLRQRGTSEYSNYRQFAVDTSSAISQTPDTR